MTNISDADICIKPFQNGQEEELIKFIVGIQRDEFGIPITASDQPDLMNIPDFYQINNGNFWTASWKNHIVGTIALRDIGGNMAALRKMFVDAKFRGSSAGTANKLMKTLLLWSKQHGIKEIYLGTTSAFLAAHRFYEKNFFMEIMKEELPESFPVMKVDSKFYKYCISSVANTHQNGEKRSP